MMRNQKGFTLIELLIVVVIIGILAAIAIPKFGKTREKAYIAAMQSDLKQIMTAQEIYYGELRTDPALAYTYYNGAAPINSGTDPATLGGFSVAVSTGVEVTITASGGGTSNAPAQWSAISTHAATDDICDVFVGVEAADKPGTIKHATTPGVIACGKP